MTEVNFYHLLKTPLEKVLPQLLEKVLSMPARAVVIAGTTDRVESVNNMLWTYDPGSFLPHGSMRDGKAQDQPIYLTNQDENPNGADVLVMLDNVVPDSLKSYKKCLTIFDGQDEESITKARQQWKEFKNLGYKISYFKQVPGGWEKKA